MNIVYLEVVPPGVEEIIRGCFPQDFNLRLRRPGEEPEDVVGEADFILVGTTPLTAETIAVAPRLKLIQHQGVGYDNVDVAAAERAEVPVALAPEGTSVSVAEHVFSLVLSIYRQLFVARESLQRGEWNRWALRPFSYDMFAKRLGILGMGRIGREVAKRAQSFGCELVYSDVVRAPTEVEDEFDLEYLPMDELLARADIVTVHVPLNDDTIGLISTRELGIMKPTAIVINAARGGIVDEEDLYNALTNGVIAGAGLDVFVEEPPPTDHPLLKLDNMVATPHIAAGTKDALVAKMGRARSNMQRVVEGKAPINQVFAPTQK